MNKKYCKICVCIAAMVMVMTVGLVAKETKLPVKGVKAHDWFGHRVAIDGEYAIVGARYDDQAGSNVGAAYIYKKNKKNWELAAKLLPGDPDPDSNFGHAVAIRGDYAIVGAQLAETKERNAGAAYIFKRSGKKWNQVAKLTASNGQQWDQFGFSVDIQDDYAVVGAIVRCDTDSEGNLLHGGLYVFENAGDSWKEVAYLKKSEPRQGDQLGQAVVISGEYIYAGGADKGKGAVHIFKNVAGDWKQADVIEVAQGTSLSRFATALDASGDNLIVGSKFEDVKGINDGCAYIYRKVARQDEKMWPFVQLIEKEFLLAEDGVTAGLTMEYFSGKEFEQSIKKLTHTNDTLLYTHEANKSFPELDLREHFTVRFTGFLVPKTSGDYILSAPSDDGSAVYIDGKHINNQVVALEAGKKYALKLDYTQLGGGYSARLNWQIPFEAATEAQRALCSEKWELVQRIEAEGGSSGDVFGYSVAISDDRAIVGAPYVSVNGAASAGVAYLFKKEGDQWKQVHRYESAEPEFMDRFGCAVAISADDTLVGAMHDDDNGYDAGLVYAWEPCAAKDK